MAAVGTLTYEFQISLPLVARFTFGAGAGGYGVMTSAMAMGAVMGGLVVANRARASRRKLGIAGVVFGTLVLVASLMPTIGAMVLWLPLVGAASVAFISMSNTNLQLAAAPDMRGRVMALYSVAFLGSTPVGGPIVGWVGQTIGPRAALVLGGVTAVSASLIAWRSLNRPAPMILTDAQLAQATHDAVLEAELLDAEKASSIPADPMIEEPEPAVPIAS
jgi:predicted MFS family arabinose efflux permease